MVTFWTLLKESTITQALLTIAIWSSIIACIFLKIEPPSYLIEAGLFVLGFFFGAKVQNTIRGRSLTTVENTKE